MDENNCNRLSLGTVDDSNNSTTYLTTTNATISGGGGSSSSITGDDDYYDDPLIELGDSCNAWVVACSESSSTIESLTVTITTTTFDTNNEYYVDSGMAETDIDTQDNRKNDGNEQEEEEDYKFDDDDDDDDSDSSSIISESILDPVYTSTHEQDEAESLLSSSSPPASQVTTATASTHTDTFVSTRAAESSTTNMRCSIDTSANVMRNNTSPVMETTYVQQQIVDPHGIGTTTTDAASNTSSPCTTDVDKNKNNGKPTTTSTTGVVPPAATTAAERKTQLILFTSIHQRLKNSMEQSEFSQQQLQLLDEKNGLPKSHSPTVVKTTRSRKQLQLGKILSKWDGSPLIDNPDCELGKPKKRRYAAAGDGETMPSPSISRRRDNK